MRRQPRRQRVHERTAQENRLEQLAAYVERNLRQRRVRLLKTPHRREKELNKKRGRDENHAAVERRQKNRARNGLACIRRLFRQRRYGVETEKRKTDDGRPGDNRQQLRVFADKRLNRPDGACALALMQAMDHKKNKHRDDSHLHRDEQRVEVRHQVDAFQVRERHDAHIEHHPDPLRHVREHRGEIELRQQDVDHRQEQIIEQRRPAHQEPHMRVNRLLGVGIGGARRREAFDQFAVADGGKQHARQRQQIRGRHVTITDAGDNAEGVEHGHRGQIGQAHHHHLPEFERFTQLRTRCVNVEIVVNRHRAFPLSSL